MKRIVVAVAAIAVLSVACSSGEDPALSGPDGENISVATDAPDPTPTSDPGTAAPGAGSNCTDAASAGGQADLEMQDFAFAPKCLQISASQGLRVHNEGEALHNWSVEGFGLDIDVEPGQENNTEATGLEAGNYTFFCKYHRDSHSMAGELRVT